MTSFSRQLRRKKRNRFMKTFKKTMKNFKKSVKCSQCSREPREGETIDAWLMQRYSDRILLACPECSQGDEQNV